MSYFCSKHEVIWEEINSPYFKCAPTSIGEKMVRSLRVRIDLPLSQVSLTPCLSPFLSPVLSSPPHPLQGRGRQGPVICSSPSSHLCSCTSGSLGRSGKPGCLSPAPVPPPSNLLSILLPPPTLLLPLPPSSILPRPSPAQASIFSSLLCIGVHGAPGEACMRLYLL